MKAGVVKNDPSVPSLDDLEIDGIEDNELALGLHGRVGIVKGQDRVRLLGDVLDGSAKKKLVAAGLARHAMQRKGWIDEGQLAASTEWFAIQIQQKPKTVGEELSRLKKAGLVDRGETGWLVPLWALRPAIEFLSE
jgi:hypothetical protein